MMCITGTVISQNRMFVVYFAWGTKKISQEEMWFLVNSSVCNLWSHSSVEEVHTADRNDVKGTGNDLQLNAQTPVDYCLPRVSSDIQFGFKTINGQWFRVGPLHVQAV